MKITNERLEKLSGELIHIIKSLEFTQKYHEKKKMKQCWLENKNHKKSKSSRKNLFDSGDITNNLIDKRRTIKKKQCFYWWYCRNKKLFLKKLWKVISEKNKIETRNWEKHWDWDV